MTTNAHKEAGERMPKYREGGGGAVHSNLEAVDVGT
jgi:hypothetical protein